MRPPFAAAVIAACLVPGPLPAAPASEEKPGKERPLPVDRTRKLIEEEAVYTVEGRVRIPRGVEVTVLRSSKIVAKGSSPAVIEVEGGFDAIGVFGREVIFENVTVEPQAKYERIHMDMVIFRGGGGFRTPKETPVEGYLLLENLDIVSGAAMDVLYQAGSVELSTVCAETPVRIRAVEKEGSSKNQVRVFVRGCPQDPMKKCTPHGGRVGLTGGLEVDGGDDVTVQLSRVGGALCAVRNWGQRLIFDGMKINSRKVEITHRKAGQFQRVQCAKCDVYSQEWLAHAPLEKGVKDTFTVDRCWFNGVTDLKEIFEKVVQDGADDPEKNGVRVQIPKVNARPLELAGPVER
jgi:hypothetical protein